MGVTSDPEYTHVLVSTGALLTAEQADQFSPDAVAPLGGQVTLW